MVNIGAFLINRLADLFFGWVIGLVVSLVVAVYAVYLSETKDKRKVFFSTQFVSTAILTILFFLTLFLSESMLISTQDLLQLWTFFLFIALVFATVFVIFRIAAAGTNYASWDFDAMDFIGPAFGGFLGVGFFVFIFLIIFIELVPFLLALLVILVLIVVVMGVPILIIVNDDFRNAILSGFRRESPILVGLTLIIIVLMMGTGYLSIFHANFVAPVDQAQYFNGFMSTSTEDLFLNEIPDYQIRLVDLDLATALVRKHSSVFGSNIKAWSLHVTTYQDRLVWVAAMAPDNLFNQKLRGLLIIDANDPARDPVQIDLEDAVISENLFYGADTSRVAWLKDRSAQYGRAYITWVPDDFTSHPKISPGQIVQIQTFNKPQALQWVVEYGGVKVFDLQGNLLETYSDRNTIPEWIAQPYDENWLERNINNWGSLRRGTGFDIFAGGFFGVTTPSADRLEISRDTRYIISPDTNQTVGVTPVHPSANSLSNAGVFLSTAKGVTFFDYRQRGYISSEAVEQYVESNEPPASQGEYYATLPMLYPIKVANQTRMAWYTPVYHKTSTLDAAGELYQTNVQFRALYILDASNQEVNGRAYLRDHGSSFGMIAEAEEHYRAAVLGREIPSTNDTEQNITSVAQVLQKVTYVQGGDSYIVLRTNHSLYDVVIASSELLTPKEWVDVLLYVDVGSIIQFKTYQSQDLWYLTEVSVL